MWDLPRPGLEPVSPALAGGFSTTVPPGKSLQCFLMSSSPHLLNSSAPEFLFGSFFRVLISLVKFSFCSLIYFWGHGTAFLGFLLAYWVYSWQLFWILYQLDHNILWLYVWFLENCYFLFVIMCYYGFSWYLMSCSSADKFEVIKTFL